MPCSNYLSYAGDIKTVAKVSLSDNAYARPGKKYILIVPHKRDFASFYIPNYGVL